MCTIAELQLPRRATQFFRYDYRSKRLFTRYTWAANVQIASGQRQHDLVALGSLTVEVDGVDHAALERDIQIENFSGLFTGGAHLLLLVRDKSFQIIISQQCHVLQAVADQAYVGKRLE